MASNEHGTPGSSDQLDLDRLIGELETEAARKRADPDYPHDADARLHFELARRAPNRARWPETSELIAKVEEVALATMGSALDTHAEAARSRRRARQVVAQHFEQIDSRVTSLGVACAGALHALSARLAQLEEQVRHLEHETDDTSQTPLAPEPGDALTQWRNRLAEMLPPDERVLYAQSRADEVVAELRSAGVDAYGITDAGPRHQPGPDVRHGDLLDHLGAVPDDALGAVLLVGAAEAMKPHTIGPLVAELGRVTKVVLIVSEAPWWWRLRLGAVNADLAPGRPLDPDTWLHAFHGVAMVGSAEYDPSGHSYRLVVRAQE